MDLPSTHRVYIKAEAGTREPVGAGMSADVDVIMPDVKKECLEYCDSVEEGTGTKKSFNWRLFYYYKTFEGTHHFPEPFYRSDNKQTGLGYK